MKIKITITDKNNEESTLEASLNTADMYQEMMDEFGLNCVNECILLLSNEAVNRVTNEYSIKDDSWKHQIVIE